MKKLLAALVAGAFAVASVGVFAMSHAGAQPAKDGKKDEMKKDDSRRKTKRRNKLFFFAQKGRGKPLPFFIGR